jgi:hypothetical protein
VVSLEPCTLLSSDFRVVLAIMMRSEDRRLVNCPFEKTHLVRNISGGRSGGPMLL